MKKITKWAGLACAVACSAVMFAGCDLANTGVNDYINPDPNAHYVELNNKLYEDFVTAKTWDNMSISVSMQTETGDTNHATMTFYKYADEYMALQEMQDKAILYVGNENGVRQYTLNSALTSVTAKESYNYDAVDYIAGFFGEYYGMARVSSVDSVTFYDGNAHISYELTELGDGPEAYKGYVEVGVDESTKALESIHYVMVNAKDAESTSFWYSFSYNSHTVQAKMSSLYLLVSDYNG